MKLISIILVDTNETNQFTMNGHNDVVTET